MAAPSDKAGMLQAGEVDMPLLDSEVILYGGYGQVGTRATVACPVCGSATHWNASSMCNNCLKSRVNISEGIPRECIVQRCRGCGRYFDPPNRWVVCDLETKELLAVCLKRIKGLNLVKLIDASFIYTEPHSRRLKVKLTIQKEAFTDVVLQQMLVVELRVHNLHCPNCHKVATKVSWSAVVQLRQRVDHKRTFYLIEQLILRHRAHGQVTQIKEVPEGVDFFFLDKRHAQTLISFITAHVPCRVKKGGERVISEDFKNNAATTRFATAVEIVPLCKDDLVRLPGMCTVVTVQVFFAREHACTSQHPLVRMRRCFYTRDNTQRSPVSVPWFSSSELVRRFVLSTCSRPMHPRLSAMHLMCERTWACVHACMPTCSRPMHPRWSHACMHETCMPSIHPSIMHTGSAASRSARRHLLQAPVRPSRISPRGHSLHRH